MGISEHGEDDHLTELYNKLNDGTLQENEEAFISRMYGIYIRVFKQHIRNGRSCRTPSIASTNGSAESIVFDPEKELTHRHLKKAVEKREGYVSSAGKSILRLGTHELSKMRQLNSVSLNSFIIN